MQKRDAWMCVCVYLQWHTNRSITPTAVFLMVYKPGCMYTNISSLGKTLRKTYISHSGPGESFYTWIWAACWPIWRSASGTLLLSITGTVQEAWLKWALGKPVWSIKPITTRADPSEFGITNNSALPLPTSCTLAAHPWLLSICESAICALPLPWTLLVLHMC